MPPKHPQCCLRAGVGCLRRDLGPELGTSARALTFGDVMIPDRASLTCIMRIGGPCGHALLLSVSLFLLRRPAARVWKIGLGASNAPYQHVATSAAVWSLCVCVCISLRLTPGWRLTNLIAKTTGFRFTAHIPETELQ